MTLKVDLGPAMLYAACRCLNTHDMAGSKVRVRDCEPGVYPAEQSRVFEPFHTTKNLLGLSICSTLAEAPAWSNRVQIPALTQSR